MSYQVILSTAARKDIKKLPEELKRRVVKKIDEIAENPRQVGIKKLEGSEYYRARVGNYRIIYDIQDRILTVMVVKIGHRKEVFLAPTLQRGSVYLAAPAASRFDTRRWSGAAGIPTLERGNEERTGSPETA